MGFDGVSAQLEADRQFALLEPQADHAKYLELAVTELTKAQRFLSRVLRYGLNNQARARRKPTAGDWQTVR